MDASKRDEYYKYWKRAVTKYLRLVRVATDGADTGAARTWPRQVLLGCAPCPPPRDGRPGSSAGGRPATAAAWDAALRGYDVMLVDRGDLSEGTSGRFHGLLHSGGRYVVKDRLAAEECVAENAILRRTIPDGDRGHRRPVRHHARRRPRLRGPLPAACKEAGLPVEEIPVAEALRREPRLNPGIRRAFVVPDASVDAWKAAWSLARGAARARRPHPHLPRGGRPAAGGRRGHRRPPAGPPHGRGARHHRRLRRSTRPARGRPRSSRWPASRASAWCRARAS